MPGFDTLIRGGTIVDGTRAPRFVGDVGIRDGRIAAIGRLDASDAAKVIEAQGSIVAPGFVDLHTHYDAQIFWDPYCTISGWHGVTTVVIGNCGGGFAPVRPDMRERMMLSLTRVDAIGIASTRVNDSIMRSRMSGRTGAKPPPQLPITTVVTPCHPEMVQYGSQKICAS